MLPCLAVQTLQQRWGPYPPFTIILFLCLLIGIFGKDGLAQGATSIIHDPQGFFGSSWGAPLENRSDLKKVDSTETLDIFTVVSGPPELEGISLESVKLYTLEGKYARALFRYHGEAVHKQLIEWLEAQYGKIQHSYGSMMRGLNQQYTWRGPETEIAITYHGFRQRGLLIAESRIFAPMFLDAVSDSGH